MKSKLLLASALMLLGCHDHHDIVLIADPRVIAIPIIENHEPVIDVTHQKAIVYGPSPEVPNNTDYTKMRETVYRKLLEAQKKLPKGVHFCLYEAYRSLSLQKKLFDYRYEMLRKENPTWTREQLFEQTTVLVSPVVHLDGSPNIPPHSTGGAIDVYLVDNQQHPLDMGMHPGDWVSDYDGRLSATNATGISPDAIKNRRLMSEVLSSVGFVNYPTEHWHWSYGDRYWAYQAQASTAIYGSLPN